MNSYAGWILLLCLGLTGCKQQTTEKPEDSKALTRSTVSTRPLADPEEARVKGLVAQFNSKPAGDHASFVYQLGTQRDVAGLTAIAHTDGYFSEFAAGEAVQIVPSENVVVYIEQFPPGSPAWRNAMYSTRKHAKEAIIAYVLEVSKQVDSPQVQTCCYDVCKERGWDDLQAAAQSALKTCGRSPSRTGVRKRSRKRRENI